MPDLYTKTTWVDGENRYDIKTQASAVISADVKLVYVGTAGGTALSSTNLNKIEQGIYDAYNGIYKINDITLTADATAINIDIPSGYLELDISMFLESSITADSTLQIQFNSITSAVYTNSNYAIKSNVGADQNTNSFNTYTSILLNGDGTYGFPITYNGKGYLKSIISNFSGYNKIFSCRYAGSCSGQRMVLADAIASITDEISEINLSGDIKTGSRIIVMGVK